SAARAARASRCAGRSRAAPPRRARPGSTRRESSDGHSSLLRMPSGLRRAFGGALRVGRFAGLEEAPRGGEALLGVGVVENQAFQVSQVAGVLPLRPDL